MMYLVKLNAYIWVDYDLIFAERFFIIYYQNKHIIIYIYIYKREIRLSFYLSFKISFMS